MLENGGLSPLLSFLSNEDPFVDRARLLVMKQIVYFDKPDTSSIQILAPGPIVFAEIGRIEAELKFFTVFAYRRTLGRA